MTMLWLAVAATGEAYRRRTQRIENIDQLALVLELPDEEDTAMSQDDRRRYL